MKTVLRASFIIGLVWGHQRLSTDSREADCGPLWPPGVGGASRPGRAANGTPTARRRWGRRAAAGPGHSGSKALGSQSSIHLGEKRANFWICWNLQKQESSGLKTRGSLPAVQRNKNTPIHIQIFATQKKLEEIVKL